MPLIIEIKTQAHEMHRYPTLGDYIGHDRLRLIQVSEMGNPHYEFLVAYHELVEQALCLSRGVSEEAITAFDIEFEKLRERGEVGATDEPGNDPTAPYYQEHQEATRAEKAMCESLGLSWDAYERFLEDFLERLGHDR